MARGTTLSDRTNEARSSQPYGSITGAIGGACNAAPAARTTGPGQGFPTGGSGGNFGTPLHTSCAGGRLVFVEQGFQSRPCLPGVFHQPNYSVIAFMTSDFPYYPQKRDRCQGIFQNKTWLTSGALLSNINIRMSVHFLRPKGTINVEIK